MPRQNNINAPSIWKWKNTAPIGKTAGEGFLILGGCLAAGIAIAATAGATIPTSLAPFIIFASPLFTNPVGIIVLLTITGYLVSRFISSWKQMKTNERIEAHIKDVNAVNKFISDIIGNELKSGEIVQQDDGLHIDLRGHDHNTFTANKTVGNDVVLNVFFGDKSAKIEFKHESDAQNVGIHALYPFSRAVK
ncbi:hypothetical protein [Wolbachia endosymbiont of Ctenocephalides felis wCfeT]|uniref:hypothetical protein n=1 Tax=Wolbachia endosymbiont of Ctenocephalides felis wCfeT TaxID=2732593 RepID=UPI001444E0AC|nr:hypothetical protein [Wolbachia endosymbiont of Ctenocephalides felis wCfeT]